MTYVKWDSSALKMNHLMRLLVITILMMTLLLISGGQSLQNKHNRFSYGEKKDGVIYRHKQIKPSSSESREVCEGESFALRCPAGQTIKLARHHFIRFGRNGPWENKTKCGRPDDDISACKEIPAKRVVMHCAGQQTCLVVLRGELREVDPCPGQPGYPNKKPRKYFIIRYSCVNSGSRWNPSRVSRPNSRLASGNIAREIQLSHTISVFNQTSPPTLPSTTAPSKNEESENNPSYKHKLYSQIQIAEKTESIISEISTSDVISDDLKSSVSVFLESMMKSVKVANRQGISSSPISVLNTTERISRQLQDLLDRQTDMNECEIKTSEMTLKVIKKPVAIEDESLDGGRTDWNSDDSRIILPDQSELVEDKQVKITLASYRNMQEEADCVSDVLTVSVNKPVNLSKPVTFLLANNGTKNVTCAYWSFIQEHWAQDGCVTVCHNETHTKCECSHLTNFALIFNVHEQFIADIGVHSTRLSLITYTGFSISILCMLLTLILFLIQRRSSTERDVIHVNLCISLLTAELIFLFGIESTGYDQVCMLIAVLLHYFFLASFAWMFLEGYQIYVLLVKVFEARKPSAIKNFLVGYLAPFIVVLVSFCVDWLKEWPSEEERTDMCYREYKRSSYGTKDYCWLRVDNHFILSFILPAALVILANFGFLIFAIQTMLRHKNKNSNGGNRSLVVTYMKGVGVLLCLLGSTWISGLLYLVFNNIYLAYVFTILNSLQGVGIFVFQGLLNPTIRSATRRNLINTLNMLKSTDDLRGKYSRTHGGQELSQGTRTQRVSSSSGSRSRSLSSRWRSRRTKKQDDLDEIENVQEAFIHDAKDDKIEDASNLMERSNEETNLENSGDEETTEARVETSLVETKLENSHEESNPENSHEKTKMKSSQSETKQGNSLKSQNDTKVENSQDD